MPFDTTTYPFIRGSTFKQNGQFRNKEVSYEKYFAVARNRKGERRRENERGKRGSESSE